MRALCIFLIAFTVAAQQKRTPLPSPFGPANALVSPDLSHALYGSATAPEVYLEDTRTHESKLILKATVQTMTFAGPPIAPRSSPTIARSAILKSLPLRCKDAR